MNRRWRRTNDTQGSRALSTRRVASGGIAIVLACACAATTLAGTTPADTTLTRIQQEARERSEVRDTLFRLTDAIGPRVVGSPAIRAAEAWLVERLRGYGLHEVRVERNGTACPPSPCQAAARQGPDMNDCDRDTRILRASPAELASADWATHVGGCHACQDMLRVKQALLADGEALSRVARLPSPHAVLWRARLRDARRRRQRVASVVAAFQCATAAIVVLALVVMMWTQLHGAANQGHDVIVAAAVVVTVLAIGILACVPRGMWWPDAGR